MNIGLEASKYSAAISSIEKAFIKLNIRVGILNITRNEYEHTIINKRNTVLNLVSKGYSNEVLEAIDDQYLQTAIERKCDVLEDFERFFDQIGSVPKLFDNELDIEIFDHDEDLEETIELHQCDERNLENLNAIYRKVTQRDKNTNSLKHDVGMIAGAEYLRTKEKTFILSQEVSVNNFSKSLPLEDGLPLSIKLETLINVLSINMDGLSSDDNFVGLFASMIRSGLTVHKDLFKPEDLCYMLEQDELVTQLPADITINIANKIHSMRVKGESDKDIHLTLTREITGGKLKIKTDLDKANLIVSNLTREKNRNAERLKETEAIIYNMAKTDSLKEWKNDVRSQYLKLLFSLIATLILTYILFKILNIEQSNISLFWNGMICIAFNIITNCLWYIFGILPNINHLQKNKEKIIKAKIEEKTKYENI